MAIGVSIPGFGRATAVSWAEGSVRQRDRPNDGRNGSVSQATGTFARYVAGPHNSGIKTLDFSG